MEISMALAGHCVSGVPLSVKPVVLLPLSPPPEQARATRTGSNTKINFFNIIILRNSFWVMNRQSNWGNS
jgi:hypothetical protein